MRKTVTILAALFTVIATGSVAQASQWIVPQLFAASIGDHGVVLTPINRTFRTLPDGSLMDGNMVEGQALQFSSLETFISEASAIPAGTIVVYDIESWSLTPAAEWAAPFKSMRLFVLVARAHHLIAGLAPGAAVRDKAARVDCDVFVAQLQNTIDPARYRAAVRLIADRIHARPGNHQMIAELSANLQRGHTVAGLYAQWRAARRYADGFSLWYGGTEPIDPALVATAEAFLDLVAVTPALVKP